MSYSTQVFVYTPREIVVTLSGNSGKFWMPQYSKPLTLNRGVDNRLSFKFLNQEEKPIDLTGLTITCRVISYDGTTVLLNKALDLDYALTGIASLNTAPADLFSIDPQRCYYSLEIPINSGNYAVYMDQNMGARGIMNIVDSVLPSFVPSSCVTIPTSQMFPNSPNSSGNTTYCYYSSVIETGGGSISTLQTEYDEYYGNVTIEGSVQPDANWYPILNNTYDDLSDTIGYTVEGFHPFIRVAFESNAGSVTNILSR